MECNKTSSLLLIGLLGAMVIAGYPLKSNV